LSTVDLGRMLEFTDDELSQLKLHTGRMSWATGDYSVGWLKVYVDAHNAITKVLRGAIERQHPQI
jgi:hypothetical protein